MTSFCGKSQEEKSQEEKSILCHNGVVKSDHSEVCEAKSATSKQMSLCAGEEQGLFIMRPSIYPDEMHLM